ncbi:MAG: hypothetical protein JKY51_00515 [Opitutaceae bacterium]|nr:hypothetical protein [Opitutaceae bacterium]
MEELIESFRQTISTYPKWLVITCALIVGVGLFWGTRKVIQFVLIFVLVVIGIAGISYLGISFFGE